MVSESQLEELHSALVEAGLGGVTLTVTDETNGEISISMRFSTLGTVTTGAIRDHGVRKVAEVYKGQVVKELWNVVHRLGG